MRKKVFQQKRTIYKIDKNSILELSFDEDGDPIAEIFICDIEKSKNYKLTAVCGNIQKTLSFQRFMLWKDSLDVVLECLREEL